MPRRFGDETTWIKGHLSHAVSPFIYFDLYKCESIRKENEDDYVIRINGETIELVDCQVVYDLTEITPPGG